MAEDEQTQGPSYVLAARLSRQVYAADAGSDDEQTPRSKQLEASLIYAKADDEHARGKTGLG